MCDNHHICSDSGGQTLEESAREYQAKHGVKPDLKEVEIVTGEEDESNVLQVSYITNYLSVQSMQ